MCKTRKRQSAKPLWCIFIIIWPPLLLYLLCFYMLSAYQTEVADIHFNYPCKDLPAEFSYLHNQRFYSWTTSFARVCVLVCLFVYLSLHLTVQPTLIPPVTVLLFCDVSPLTFFLRFKSLLTAVRLQHFSPYHHNYITHLGVVKPISISVEMAILFVFVSVYKEKQIWPCGFKQKFVKTTVN